MSVIINYPNVPTNGSPLPALTETTEQVDERLNFLKEKTTYTAGESTEITSAINYLTAKAGANPATRFTASNAQLNTLKAEIKQAQEDLQIAEERVATLRNPGKDKSYYESFFPINRPLTQTTIVILLAIGIFFFVLSFFIIIKGLGFNLSMTAPWDNPELIAKFLALFPPIIVNNFNLIIIAFIAVLIILNIVKK
jgi:hypothetical protein